MFLSFINIPFAANHRINRAFCFNSILRGRIKIKPQKLNIKMAEQNAKLSLTLLQKGVYNQDPRVLVITSYVEISVLAWIVPIENPGV
jgi:hypothetical protein